MLETLISRQPQHAGAWLDLALLYCDLGFDEKSHDILDHIETHFAPSPVILDLIKLQRSRVCKTSDGGPRWTVGIQAGHDSNVNRGASSNRVVLESGAGPIVAQLTDDALPKSDYFSEAWAEAYWRKNSRSLRLSVLSRQYQQLTAYNAQALSLTGEQAWTARQMDGTLRVQWASAWLGGSSFLDTLTASASAITHNAWHGLHPAVDVALAHNRFPVAPAFDSYVWSVRPGLAKNHAATSWRTNIIATADLANGARPGGDRYGMGAEILGTWRLAQGIQLSGSGLIQQIRNTEPYFSPLVNTYRKQLLWLGRLELSVELGRGIHWLTAWTGQRSDDNLAFLDYRANVLQSGLMMKF